MKCLFSSILSVAFAFLFANHTYSQQESALQDKNLVELRQATSASGDDSVAKARAVVSWTRSNSASSLPIRDQVSLLEILDVPDKAHKNRMSVRWTGQLRAPISGEYVFRQLRTDRVNGTMRLWLNGRLILGRERDAPSRQAPTASFRSSPIMLEAGRSADFRLEYSFDNREVRRIPDSPDCPIAVLLWESPTLERQVVSANAFLQPDGKTPGLRAEYFSDAEFQSKLAEQIDPAVDFVWDRRPVYNEFSNEQRKIAQGMIPRVSSDTFLASLKEDDATDFSRRDLPRLLRFSSASERAALLHAIGRHKQLLRGFPVRDLAEQIQTFSLLPEQQVSQLLIDWSEENPLPRMVPAILVAGSGEYVRDNLAVFIQIGRALNKLKPTEQNDLFEEQLILPDGQCNLTLTYSLALADGAIKPRVLLNQIDAHTQDKSGDVKATWLIAKAYLKENALPHIPRPGRGLSELQEALATAESATYRFWVLQEIVTRLLATDQSDEASSLIGSMRGQFADVEHQAEMTAWIELGQRLKEQYTEIRDKAGESAADTYNKEMQRRLSVARDLKDAALEKQIETSLPNPVTRQNRRQ